MSSHRNNYRCHFNNFYELATHLGDTSQKVATTAIKRTSIHEMSVSEIPSLNKCPSNLRSFAIKHMIAIHCNVHQIILPHIILCFKSNTYYCIYHMRCNTMVWESQFNAVQFCTRSYEYSYTHTNRLFPYTVMIHVCNLTSLYNSTTLNTTNQNNLQFLEQLEKIYCRPILKTSADCEF